MTVDVHKVVSEKVSEILKESRQFPPVERLTLAKLLLESVLAEELDAGAEWSALGLEAFQREWDNEEDAIYDNWREHYGVPAR